MEIEHVKTICPTDACPNNLKDILYGYALLVRAYLARTDASFAPEGEDAESAPSAAALMAAMKAAWTAAELLLGSAHGGVRWIETCRECGASREVLANGGQYEFGEWVAE